MEHSGNRKSTRLMLVRWEADVPGTTPPTLIVTLLATSICKTVFDGVPFPGLAILVVADNFCTLTFVGGRGVSLWVNVFAIGSGR